MLPPLRFLIPLRPLLVLLLIVLTAGVLLLSKPYMACRGSAEESQWPRPLLIESWQYFKTALMKDGERVESNHYGGTITEGQSYALLKAVWMDDRETFERVWQWTKTHMHRPDDHLLGWHWKDGTLKETETATDADQDIAYALLLAGERWNNPAYLADAKSMIADLWRLQVVQIRDRYYLAPGTWSEFRNGALTINPSYFAPYVYRKFAAYDPDHAWQALAQDIYPTLEACTALRDDKLPPNWCAADWETGQIGWSDKQGDGSRDFSYDAVRVFWRMAMDAHLNQSGEGKRYLEEHPVDPDSPAFSEHFRPFVLGAALARASVVSPESSRALYDEGFAPQYHSEGYWFNSYSEYLHSVLWFGLYTLNF